MGRLGIFINLEARPRTREFINDIKQEIPNLKRNSDLLYHVLKSFVPMRRENAKLKNKIIVLQTKYEALQETINASKKV